MFLLALSSSILPKISNSCGVNYICDLSYFSFGGVVLQGWWIHRLIWCGLIVFYTLGLILEAAVVLLITPLLLLHVHMSQLGKFLIIWSYLSRSNVMQTIMLLGGTFTLSFSLQRKAAPPLMMPWILTICWVSSHTSSGAQFLLLGFFLVGV